MKNDDKEARRKYRFQLANDDFDLAKEIAQHLLDNHWYHNKYLREGSARMQQTAFTTAFVVTYNRPFTRGNGWDKLPYKELEASFAPEEKQLHKDLKDLRDKVHAHTDHEGHDRRLWPGRFGQPMFTMVNAPPYHLTKDQLEVAIEMLDKFKLYFSPPPPA